MKYTFLDKNQKLVIIGCGYWGTIVTKTLIKLNFKNINIHDENKKNILNLKKKYPQLKIIHNIKDILEDKEILNCFLITPPSKNFNLIKKFIKYKKNIFVEKPAVTNERQLLNIKKLLKHTKIKFMIGYVYCFNNQIEKIKDIISSKTLGKILYINFQRQNLGPIRNDVDVDYDLTSHDLSILLNLFNKLPKLKSKRKYDFLKKKISDISNLHLKIDNTIIDINNSWINPNKIRKITIIGSKKMMLFNELDQENSIIIYNQYAKYPDTNFFDKKFLNKKAYIYQGKQKKIKIKHTFPLENEIKHFFNAKKPKTNIDFGLKILSFLKRI